ncbi:hypothetical protein BJV74DRAFT_883321 [Russula compacta]|nr:hypothetical protein BJV74DRAFT_883321 [Russula compacta]
MPVFGHIVTADTHSAIVRALADGGHTAALLKWLSTMPAKPGSIQPTLESWHMFMDHCLVNSNIQTMSRGIHLMRSQGRPANNVTYKFLIRKVFMSSSHHFLWTIRIINHISRARLPFDDMLLCICWKALMAWQPPPGRRGGCSAVISHSSWKWVPTVSSHLDRLLDDARKAEDIAFWEQTLEMKAVLKIYRAARVAGVSVDVALAEPVIRSLCSSSLQSPKDAALDLAVALFQTLFRALSAAANKAKYMTIAIDLLEEMKRRGLSDSAHVTSLVILLMRSASSFAEAFDAYKTVRERTQIPSRRKIVKDMQENGSPILPHLYTNMLRQMARMAARARPSDPDYITNQQKIVHTAREVQHLLSISTSATLDTPFWNQLMDTYQRAGAFEDARRIWDKLFHEGRVDAASVSIIFDACGYARAGRTAVQIFASLRASGYRLNLRNWHAWLECLCRLGQLDDAARYFCLEMGSGPHGMAPDEQGARILLKFANQRGVGDEVRLRIQRFLPALWGKLPPDIVQGPY